MKLLYIIGEPGIGKTTTVRMITSGTRGVFMKAPYITWTEYGPGVCQLGHDRDVFGGTDALGMAAQKHVIKKLFEWYAEDAYPFVLAEGDRLANAKFFEKCLRYNIDLDVVALWNPDVAAERREERNSRINKPQAERWVRSRQSKVSSLISKYVPEENIIDVSKGKAEVKRVLGDHPVVQAIRACASQKVGSEDAQ